MKFPSRRGQPGDALAALCHRPVAGLLALCCPFTSCTYHLGRDTTSPSRSRALPCLQCPH